MSVELRERPRSTVHGTVTDATGEPVEGAPVAVLSFWMMSGVACSCTSSTAAKSSNALRYILFRLQRGVW